MPFIEDPTLNKKIIEPTEEPKRVGFLQSLAQSTIDPFAKTAVTGASAIKGIGQMAKAGGQYISGNKQGALQSIAKAGQPANLNLGGLGQYTAMGTGKSTGEQLREGVATGTKIASWATPAKLGFVKGGATVGGLYGGAEAIEQGKDIKGVALDTTKGAITGAILGKITKEVVGKFPFTKTAKDKALKDALKATESFLDKGGKESAILRAGKEGGAKKIGILKTIKPTITKEDMEIANSVSNLGMGGDPIQNATKINKQISRFSEEVLNPYIKQNSKPIGDQDLSTLLSKIEEIQPETILSSDPTTNSVFNGVKLKIKDMIIGNASDDVSLYSTRKMLDNIVEQESKGQVWEKEGRAAFQAIRKSRQIMNDFLANRMPDPSVVKNGLRYEHNLYSALERIAESPKNQKVIDTDVAQRIWRAVKGPIAYLIPGAGLGYGVRSLFNK